MGKFVIALDSGSKAEQDGVTAFFQAKNWEVWHWLEDLWLVAGVPETVDAGDLTAEIRKAVPGVEQRRHLVMRVEDPISYYGGVAVDAWPWMQQKWGRVSMPAGT